MKTLALLLMLSLVPCTDVLAAFQSFPINSRIPVIYMNNTGQLGNRSYEVRRNFYSFQVQVFSDTDGLKTESSQNGKPFIAANREERFAVRLFNPLPVRVAVNLTVDGLNSISGKPSGISDGDKWMIDPYSFITIRGWQVNTGEERRFFFTNKHQSYAKWTGHRMGRDLSANCGVIGVAYFWSQRELDAYYEARPEYRYTYNYPYPGARMQAIPSSTLASPMLKDAPEAAAAMGVAAKEQLAGTGMGERESNPTTLVDFHYDTGMYELAQAVTIYYDFVNLEPLPNPFPAISYASEMP